MLKVKNSISAVQVVFWQIRLWKLRCVELKTFLKNFLNLKGMFENLFQPATLLRKRISYRNFPKYFVYFLNFFRTAIFNTGGWHCVHSPSPPAPFLQWQEGRGLYLLANFQKGGDLTRPQLLEGCCWERGGDLFEEGNCNFQIKNRLKS